MQSKAMKIIMSVCIVVALCVGFVAGRYKYEPNVMEPTTPLNTAEMLHEAISYDDLYSFKTLWSPLLQGHTNQALIDRLHRHMDPKGAGVATQIVVTDKYGHEIIADLTPPYPEFNNEYLIQGIQIVK